MQQLLQNNFAKDSKKIAEEKYSPPVTFCFTLAHWL
jgi:hypothetical protein